MTMVGIHACALEILAAAGAPFFEAVRLGRGMALALKTALPMRAEKQRWIPSTRASGGTVKSEDTAQAGMRAPLQSVRQYRHSRLVAFEKFNCLLVGHAYTQR